MSVSSKIPNSYTMKDKVMIVGGLFAARYLESVQNKNALPSMDVLLSCTTGGAIMAILGLVDSETPPEVKIGTVAVVTGIGAMMIDANNCYCDNHNRSFLTVLATFVVAASAYHFVSSYLAEWNPFGAKKQKVDQ